MVEKTEFTIFGSIGQGWQLVKGFKGTFWGAFILYLLFGLALNIIIGIMVFLIKAVGGNPQLSIISREILEFVAAIILLPVFAGIWMLAIKRVRQEKARALTIFSYYDHIWRLLAYQVILLLISFACLFVGFLVAYGLMSLTIDRNISMVIGYIIGGIPLLYFVVSYIFAIPVLVDKKLGPWDALETSRRIVTPHWFSVFGLMIVLTIIVFISIIPLGIGLIWSMPLNLLTFGVVYKILFQEINVN